MVSPTNVFTMTKNTGLICKTIIITGTGHEFFEILKIFDFFKIFKCKTVLDLLSCTDELQLRIDTQQVEICNISKKIQLSEFFKLLDRF